MPAVGIVGFGRCGRLAASMLSATHDVAVTDRDDRADEAEALGVRWAGLGEVVSRDRVLLAVPIRALPEALDAAAAHLSSGALVVDCASVKVEPMRWMAARLPDRVRWAGTHPLFGPDSVNESRRIVVCEAPGGAEAASEVEAVARDLGLEPIRATPEEHDRTMARSQALVFLLARAFRRAGLGDVPFGTPSERRVLKALSVVGRDTEELYEDILRHNPFASATTGSLAEAIRIELDRVLGE